MHIVEIILLTVGIACVCISSVGALLAREPLDRLHLLAPASTLGAPLVCVAVMLNEGLQRTTVKVAVIAVLIVVLQPAITAATGRAISAARGLISVDNET